jgi:hypothetical protein
MGTSNRRPHASLLPHMARQSRACSQRPRHQIRTNERYSSHHSWKKASTIWFTKQVLVLSQWPLGDHFAFSALPLTSIFAFLKPVQNPHVIDYVLESAAATTPNRCVMFHGGMPDAEKKQLFQPLMKAATNSISCRFGVGVCCARRSAPPPFFELPP